MALRRGELKHQVAEQGGAAIRRGDELELEHGAEPCARYEHLRRQAVASKRTGVASSPAAEQVRDLVRRPKTSVDPCHQYRVGWSMVDPVKKHVDELLKLPPDERSEAAEVLLRSLEQEPEEDEVVVAAAWAAERDRAPDRRERAGHPR